MHSENPAIGADIISEFAGMECAHDSWGDFVADHREALSVQTACRRPMPFELFDCVRWHHEVIKEPGMIPTDCLEILVPYPNTQHQPPLWANAELQPAYYIESGTIAYLHRVNPDHSDSEADRELFHAVKNTGYLASELSRVRSVSKPPGYTCLATRVPPAVKPVNGFFGAVNFLAQCHPMPSVRDDIFHAISYFALENGVAA